MSSDVAEQRVVVARLEQREVELGLGTTLLRKLGWAPGAGLGKHQTGVIRPISLPSPAGSNTGLGFRLDPSKKKHKKEGGPAPVEFVCECGEIIKGRQNIKVFDPRAMLNVFCSKKNEKRITRRNTRRNQRGKRAMYA